MIDNKEFKKFKKGDRIIFKKVFDSFYNGLFLFANKYVNNHQESEDILQEVFSMLWNKKDEIKNADSLKAFLYVSVRNSALNIIRRKKLVDNSNSQLKIDLYDEDFYKENLIEEETFRILIQAIETLPSQTSKVCKMVLNGSRNIDIAEELGITTHTVKYHKQQAFSELKKKLSNHIYLCVLLSAFFEL
ncbi:MAG: RNA polymerase sigma-70 factor [Marinifilaceae bacterium]|jgi:RNA polymerase sigma-70 factor (ECF subfamily)|nr:RNA polymerase sigma-70 factor [Marinifilaceae bacterium]